MAGRRRTVWTLLRSSPMGLFHLLPDKISPDFYIACSGAAVFDRSRNVICGAVIEKEDVRELLGRYGPSVLFAAFHTDSPDALYRSRNTGRMWWTLWQRRCWLSDRLCL